MKINDLRPHRGAKKKEKRIGRGIGSGHGKTSTKGHKGALARSGGKKAPGFEGGQNPLIRRIPKRGFKPYRQTKPSIINLDSLKGLNPEKPVNLEILREAGLIKGSTKSVKVLGQGEVKKPFKVEAHFFSRSAIEKIKKAGGQATVIQKSVRTHNKKEAPSVS